MIPKIITRHPCISAATLLAGGLLATFGWSLHAPTFISHEGSILRLPLLGWWKNLPLIFSRDFLMFTEGQFRPLSYALLAAIRTFVGPGDVLFWHIWLLAFHWLNAVQVFVLVRHFSKHFGSAVLSAMIFGLHPLTSGMVNQINYFHYLLGLTFYLSAVCCYLSFVCTPRRRYYVGAVSLFILGLFTSKIVFTLPLVLAAYEVLYRRSGLRVVFVRLLPFVVLSLLLCPLWWFYKPHPLHYKPIEFPAGAGWNSFFSVVGATGFYAKGLLLGWDIPIVLHEVVERIFGFTYWKFLFWALVDLGILIGAGWTMWRQRWVGLGVVLLFGTMLPFSSTLWNGVEDYVSWAYLYVPLAGLAFLVGGLADGLWSSGRRGLRAGGLAVLCLLGLYYGIQQVHLNVTSRSAVGYWERILRLNPDSEVASLELGKAHLKRGEVGEALGFLFSPGITQLHKSCLAMSRYYGVRGDLLASAVHLGMVSREEQGLQFQDYEMAAAELFYAAGVPDHAEAASGRSLIANPFNVAAMEWLAQVWLLKGYVAAAGRLAERASEIAPSHPGVGRMWTMLEAHRSASVDSRTSQVVHPPESGWLRYVMQGVRDSRLREEIVRSGEGHPNDPVIQMEAGICLVQDERPDHALPKLDFAVQSLSSYAYAWAMKCWALTEDGAYEEAEVAGQRALELDSQSPTVHTILGALEKRLAGDLPEKGPARQRKLDRAIGHYQQALQLNPKDAVAYNNLGNLLAKKGRLDRAIEHYRQALDIKLDFAEAHNNLGIALARQGEFEEAMVHFRKALHIKSDFAEAHNNLGIALAQQGKPKEAIAHFQQALRIRPDYVHARDNLSKVLVGQRR